MVRNQSTKVYRNNINFDNNDEEEEDVVKKVPGIETIMEKLGKTICDSDEISLPQLTAQFTIWLKRNLISTPPNFFESEFKTTFMDLISSIHQAPEGGPHLVCHGPAVTDSSESVKSHECLPNKEAEERNAAIIQFS